MKFRWEDFGVKLTGNNVEKLKEELAEARRLMELTATAPNVTHTVYPQCNCGSCAQRRFLDRKEKA